MDGYINLEDHKDLREWLLAILELKTKYPIGNYQDIFLNETGTKIILYTRDGGPNRLHSDKIITPEGKDCECTGCIMTHKIPLNPHYMGDYDDDNEGDYAYVVYRVPKKYESACKKHAANAPFMNCNIY